MSHEPSNAEAYEAVLRARGGELFPLGPGESKMLRLMLMDELGCDAEITPISFIIRYGASGRDAAYVLFVAPGLVSYLLDGGLPESRHMIRRIDPAVAPDSRAPSPEPSFGVRYVRIEADANRLGIRVRDSEQGLADPIPEPSIQPPRFVALARTCPHCGHGFLRRAARVGGRPGRLHSRY